MRPTTTSTGKELITAARTLSSAVDRLKFSAPVAHVYNPLAYARIPHEKYLARFGQGRKRVVFLGMNPGPFGMAQTGVPFGEVAAVRDWMGLCGRVGRPEAEHSNRPILGFACPRSEVSGRRLWELFARRFGSSEAFFACHFVVNYCPLAFLEAGGRNRTPDKLLPAEKQRLFDLCDGHLRRVLKILQPEWLIGVGAFATERGRPLADVLKIRVGQILHPSPANPAANRDWAYVATQQLVRLGVWE